MGPTAIHCCVSHMISDLLMSLGYMYSSILLICLFIALYTLHSCCLSCGHSCVLAVFVRSGTVPKRLSRGQGTRKVEAPSIDIPPFNWTFHPISSKCSALTRLLWKYPLLYSFLITSSQRASGACTSITAKVLPSPPTKTPTSPLRSFWSWPKHKTFWKSKLLLLKRPETCTCLPVSVHPSVPYTLTKSRNC